MSTTYTGSVDGSPFTLTTQPGQVFPDDRQGTLVELDALPPGASVDGIFYFNSPNSGKYLARVIDGSIRAVQCGVYAGGTASDNTTRLQAAFSHAMIQEVVFDDPAGGTIDIDDEIIIPAGKKLSFRQGNLIGGVGGKITGGIIDAGYDQQIFTTDVTADPEGLATDMFSIKWFGAVGSGSVDDQPAIQTAGDTIIRNNKLPRALYFPHGTYRIDSPLFFFKWSGSDYAFFSLNLVGQEAAHFANEQIEATIVANFTDTFAIGYQVARSSIIKGLFIQGQFNPTGSSNYKEYVLRPYSTWASSFGVRDNQYSPYAGIVLDPVRNTNTLGAGDRYPGLSSYYRGTGALINSGCSGIIISQCRVKGFTVNVILSPNGETSNAENIHVIDCTLEVAKCAYAATQDQCKDNFLIRCISWDRVHTLVDTITWGRLSGQAPYVDGWNVAGNVIQICNLFPLRNASTFKNIFAESLWRIGAVGGGAPLTIQNSQFDFNLIDPKLVPSTHITGGGLIMRGCFLRYYNNLYERPMVLRGAFYEFEDCFLDRPPVTEYDNINENFVSITLRNCRTGAGFMGIFEGKGYLAPTAPVFVQYATVNIGDGGLLTDNNPAGFRSLNYRFNCGAYQKYVNLGTVTYTTDDTARTATITGMTGSNKEFQIAVGDFLITESGNQYLGRIVSVNRGAGSATIADVPADVNYSGSANIVALYTDRIAGMFVGDLTSGSATITNVDFDTAFPPLYVGQRLKVGHSIYNLIVDAINAGAHTVTMSFPADYTQVGAYNGFVGSLTNNEDISVQCLYADRPSAYSGTDYVLIPERMKFIAKKDQYATGMIWECTQAGYLRTADGVNRFHQAQWRKIYPTPDIRPENATSTLLTSDDTVLADSSSGNITLTVPNKIGKIYTVKKVSADVNTVTVSPASGTIDGAGTYVLSAQYDMVRLQSDGANFFVI